VTLVANKTTVLTSSGLDNSVIVKPYKKRKRIGKRMLLIIHDACYNFQAFIT
jgi:hypothetical protein